MKANIGGNVNHIEECVNIGFFEQNEANSYKALIKNLVRKLYVAVLMLGKNKRNPVVPSNPKSVIACSGGNLGGTILSLPLLAQIKFRFPKSKLVVVCNTSIGAECVKYSGVADSIYVIDALNKDAIKSTLATLKSYKAGLLITNFDCHIEKYLVSLRIPIRVGHVANLHGDDIVWNTSNIPIKVEKGMNWLKAHEKIAKALGGGTLNSPLIKPTEDSVRSGNEILKSSGWDGKSLCIALQAGVWGGHSFKQWPTEKLGRVAQRLWTEYHIQPVFIGNEKDKAGVDEMRKNFPGLPLIDVTGRTDYSKLIGVVSSCAATITNDSGLMHVSASLNKITVAIYGMTDPKKTWCYDNDSIYKIVRRSDCRPCLGEEGFPEKCKHRKCLVGIKEDQVYEAITSLLLTNGIIS